MSDSDTVTTSGDSRPSPTDEGGSSGPWMRFLAIVPRYLVAGLVIAGGFLVIYPPLKDVTEATSNLALAQAQLAEVRAAIQNERNELARLELEEETRAYRKQVTTLQAERATMLSDLERVQRIKEQLALELASRSQEIDTLATVATRSNEEKEAYRRIMTDAQVRLAKLQLQLDSLRMNQTETTLPSEETKSSMRDKLLDTWELRAEDWGELKVRFRDDGSLNAEVQRRGIMSVIPKGSHSGEWEVSGDSVKFTAGRLGRYAGRLSGSCREWLGIAAATRRLGRHVRNRGRDSLRQTRDRGR
jgi:hypothetical protein